MIDLLPCRFCGAAPHAWLDDYINGRIVPDPYYIVECENADCSVYPEIRGIWPRTDEVRAMWNAANALPAEQPDAAAIRETALREVLAKLAGVELFGTTTQDTHAALEQYARCRDVILAALLNAPTGKEVMPDDTKANIPHAQRSDEAPAGLSAGGGAGWQPIETAPKDRVIDLWSVEGGRYPDAVWGVCGDTEGWTDANDHRDLEGFTFTNWRDRPAKPATKGGA